MERVADVRIAEKGGLGTGGIEEITGARELGLRKNRKRGGTQGMRGSRKEVEDRGQCSRRLTKRGRRRAQLACFQFRVG